jgi:membrane protease YdiL (CAAX protease family)
MALPTLLTWLYFVALATGEANPLQQAAYAAGKVAQFGWPVLAAWWLDRAFPRPSRPHFRGLLLGLAFGLLVAGGMFCLYFALLRGSEVLADTSRRVTDKLVELGLTSLSAYLLFGVFLSVFHSLFEEYYWRWFVFGRLRRLLPLAPALVLAALAFAAHHVLVLHIYFPGRFFSAVLPFSLCIAAGGVAWGWLYERTGSIYSCWLSHALVDLAIMVIGYDLCFR